MHITGPLPVGTMAVPIEPFLSQVTKRQFLLTLLIPLSSKQGMRIKLFTLRSDKRGVPLYTVKKSKGKKVMRGEILFDLKTKFSGLIW